MTNPRQDRLTHIETIRGIACVLLVSYHVVGDVPANGLRLAEDHVLAIVNNAFGSVRMPLFSFVSGYVLHALVDDAAALRDSIATKARRLLLPFLFVATLHYAVQSAVYGGNAMPMWRIYLYAYEHFWFLQATFLLMVFLFGMAYLAGPEIRRTIFLVFLFSLFAFVLAAEIANDLFSTSRAIFLAPFFLTGQICRMHHLDRRLAEAPRWRLALIGIGLVIVLPALAQLILDPEPWQRGAAAKQTPLGLAVALATCLTLFCLRWDNRLLAWIGTRSYPIFLFHVFFTAGTRIVALGLFGPLSEYLLFALGLGAGLAGPVALNRLILLSPWASLAFLGIRQRPRRPAYAQ